MKRYLVLYQSAASAEEQMANATPEQAAAGMDVWMAWARRAGDAIVDLGAPMGAGRRIEAGSSSDRQTPVRGYSILQAQSLDEVGPLLEQHPHLTMPGASIEVLEALAMPGA
jgi:hypothetical protein